MTGGSVQWRHLSSRKPCSRAKCVKAYILKGSEVCFGEPVIFIRAATECLRLFSSELKMCQLYWCPDRILVAILQYCHQYKSCFGKGRLFSLLPDVCTTHVCKITTSHTRDACEDAVQPPILCGNGWRSKQVNVQHSFHLLKPAVT